MENGKQVTSSRERSYRHRWRVDLHVAVDQWQRHAVATTRHRRRTQRESGGTYRSTVVWLVTSGRQQANARAQERERACHYRREYLQMTGSPHKEQLTWMAGRAKQFRRSRPAKTANSTASFDRVRRTQRWELVANHHSIHMHVTHCVPIQSRCQRAQRWPVQQPTLVELQICTFNVMACTKSDTHWFFLILVPPNLLISSLFTDNGNTVKNKKSQLYLTRIKEVKLDKIK